MLDFATGGPGTELTREELINKFIAPQLERYKGCDRDVLQFIASARYHMGYSSEVVLDEFFLTGWCYYFALMLKEAFKRGVICNNGRSHIIWLDGTNQFTDVAYDITGVYTDYEVLIPVKAMGMTIFDFMNIPGLVHKTTEQEVNELVNSFKGVSDFRRYV